jgi:hypothetical protein
LNRKNNRGSRSSKVYRLKGIVVNWLRSNLNSWIQKELRGSRVDDLSFSDPKEGNKMKLTYIMIKIKIEQFDILIE